jgi:hypothetical protein
VADEIRQRWPQVEVWPSSNVGGLEPGTPTVLIACSAAHRDTGVFEAARYGIDRLREIVPVWKKEVAHPGSLGRRQLSSRRSGSGLPADPRRPPRRRVRGDRDPTAIPQPGGLRLHKLPAPLPGNRLSVPLPPLSGLFDFAPIRYAPTPDLRTRGLLRHRASFRCRPARLGSAWGRSAPLAAAHRLAPDLLECEHLNPPVPSRTGARLSW